MVCKMELKYWLKLTKCNRRLSLMIIHFFFTIRWCEITKATHDFARLLVEQTGPDCIFETEMEAYCQHFTLLPLRKNTIHTVYASITTRAFYGPMMNHSKLTFWAECFSFFFLWRIPRKTAIPRSSSLPRPF